MGSYLEKSLIKKANRLISVEKEKDTLRQQLKKKRASLSLKRRKEAEHSLFQTLFPLLASHTLVLSFSPLPEEIDISSLNKQLMQENRLVLPKIVDQELHLYRVTSALQPGVFGVMEPDSKSEKIDFSSLTSALIPGLGFDGFFHRLGYGKGYYDRLLSQSTLPLCWGIGFREQWIEKLPTVSTDYALSNLFLF